MFIEDPHTHLVVDSAKPILSRYHRLVIDKSILVSMDVDTDDPYPFFYDFDSSRPQYISHVSYSNLSQLPHLLVKSNFVLHPSDKDYRPTKQIKFGHTRSKWASSIAECFTDFANQGRVVEGGFIIRAPHEHIWAKTFFLQDLPPTVLPLIPWIKGVYVMHGSDLSKPSIVARRIFNPNQKF